MEIVLPPEWNIELPTDRPLTVDDYLRLPEGPPHYELIEGVLILNASSASPHARASTNLGVVLHAACPPDQELFAVPLDWVADDLNVLEPDLMVIDRAGGHPKRQYEPPLLVVEILSPSTKVRDLTVKRDIYERRGVASYWILDPLEPRLLVHRLDLRTGRYRDRTEHGPGATFEATHPFPVTIEVDALVR